MSKKTLNQNLEARQTPSDLESKKSAASVDPFYVHMICRYMEYLMAAHDVEEPVVTPESASNAQILSIHLSSNVDPEPINIFIEVLDIALSELEDGLSKGDSGVRMIFRDVNDGTEFDAREPDNIPDEEHEVGVFLSAWPENFVELFRAISDCQQLNWKDSAYTFTPDSKTTLNDSQRIEAAETLDENPHLVGLLDETYTGKDDMLQHILKLKMEFSNLSSLAADDNEDPPSKTFKSIIETQPPYSLDDISRAIVTHNEKLLGQPLPQTSPKLYLH